ncbi:hypothetical protein M9458_031289, partial [Cirrhinus mrigala]
SPQPAACEIGSTSRRGDARHIHLASEGSARFTLAAVEHLARRGRVRAVPLRTLPEALRRVVSDRVPYGKLPGAALGRDGAFTHSYCSPENASLLAVCMDRRRTP